MYYWVCAIGTNGRCFIERHPFLSQESAEDYASNLNTKTLIFPSEKRDRKEAAREIRQKLAQQGHEEWAKNFSWEKGKSQEVDLDG